MGKKRNYKRRSVIAFYEKNKRWPVPTAKNLRERQLGSWITRFRHYRNHYPEKLTEKEIELIDRIDADRYQKSIDLWEGNFYKLKDFWEKEKRWPSSKSSDPQEIKLSNWCVTQRTLKKKKPKDAIINKRIKMLDSIEFIWNTYSKRRSWDESFKLVKNFCTQNGRWPVHTNNQEESKLAKWCSKMRAYRWGTDPSMKLTPKQIQKLTRLGFDWTCDVTRQGRAPEKINLVWLDRYEEFRNFITTEKRYPRSNSKDAKEEKLYSWWMRMAHLRRKNKLNEDRIQLLDCIGFRWGNNELQKHTKKEV